MSKSTLLGLLCVGLLLLNIFLSVMMYFQKPQPPHQGSKDNKANSAQILIKRLHLDPEQAETFRNLRDEHMELNESINSEIHQAYDQLFLLLQKEKMDEVKKSQLFIEIEGLTSALNSSNFEHFKSLKSILRQDQKKYFNSFTRELRMKFGPQENQAGPARR